MIHWIAFSHPSMTSIQQPSRLSILLFWVLTRHPSTASIAVSQFGQIVGGCRGNGNIWRNVLGSSLKATDFATPWISVCICTWNILCADNFIYFGFSLSLCYLWNVESTYNLSVTVIFIITLCSYIVCVSLWRSSWINNDFYLPWQLNLPVICCT